MATGPVSPIAATSANDTTGLAGGSLAAPSWVVLALALLVVIAAVALSVQQLRRRARGGA